MQCFGQGLAFVGALPVDQGYNDRAVRADEDWSGGGKASKLLRTARHSRMLMCRSFSSGVQHPEAEGLREETPPQPEQDASVQKVTVGGGREMGAG